MAMIFENTGIVLLLGPQLLTDTTQRLKPGDVVIRDPNGLLPHNGAWTLSSAADLCHEDVRPVMIALSEEAERGGHNVEKVQSMKNWTWHIAEENLSALGVKVEVQHVHTGGGYNEKKSMQLELQVTDLATKRWPPDLWRKLLRNFVPNETSFGDHKITVPRTFKPDLHLSRFYMVEEVLLASEVKLHSQQSRSTNLNGSAAIGTKEPGGLESNMAADMSVQSLVSANARKDCRVVWAVKLRCLDFKCISALSEPKRLNFGALHDSPSSAPLYNYKLPTKDRAKSEMNVKHVRVDEEFWENERLEDGIWQDPKPRAYYYFSQDPVKRYSRWSPLQTMIITNDDKDHVIDGLLPQGWTWEQQGWQCDDWEYGHMFDNKGAPVPGALNRVRRRRWWRARERRSSLE